MLQQPPPLLLRAFNPLLFPLAMLQQPPPRLLRALNCLLLPSATLHQLLLHWSHCLSATMSSLSLVPCLKLTRPSSLASVFTRA
ncbi:hypothetical protein D6D18_10495 [Aureobasidium pullulans]|nr:hypothetical protein D6D18_10495 [Aureobasidium pullulans]TIA03859.1 hypothetical protein D6C82_01434 [Aureobasidium pullulans]